MEKCIDDNKSNGINPFSDNAVLREPSCPFTGKDTRRAERGSYKMAYPDRVAILKENARKNRLFRRVRRGCCGNIFVGMR